MTEVLLVCAVAIGALNLLAQLFGSSRKANATDGASVQTALQQVEKSTDRVERTMRDEIVKNREEAASAARHGREELAHPILQMRQTIDGKLTELQVANAKHAETIRNEAGASAGKIREDVVIMLQTFNETVSARVTTFGTSQKEQLERMQAELAKLTTSTDQRLERLTESNAQKLELLKAAVELKLGAMQEDNGKQLEQMRITVDEKLHGTLEKRLGESFKQVSDRLEQVHKGLGEMQVLAAGVGDLKKVLTNVKTRGTWGEVQLRSLLSQVLSPAQYEENVSPHGNADRVEFVVKMPGRGATDDVVWLPIDAKFPIEDYRRLIDAEEHGEAELMKAAGAALELQVKHCAKTIHDKYIVPPKTTDFAILFLPVEGLFAEVIRRTDLVDHLQQQYRVVVAGPTTLWSILNSLQMGFRSLAIQKRSSEVWHLLGAVKTEWGRYAETLEKVKKKLLETSGAVDDAAKRARAVGRRLNDVEALPDGEAGVVLLLDNHIAAAAVSESADIDGS